MQDENDTLGQLAKMERFSVHAVESIIRGDDWMDDFTNFFRTTSPTFKEFREKTSKITEGVGFDCQMFAVQSEFVNLIEKKLMGTLKKMGLSMETFLRSVEVNLQDEDQAVVRFFTLISTYTNFTAFGNLMEDKYHELYSTASTASLRSVTVTPSHQNVRVLWDIENITVSNKLGGMFVVTKIHQFLRSQSLLGPGIDTRITAFFNPQSTSLSDRTIQELDKAAVEMVWVSRKREDADRKLGMRINQEMQVLNPSSTTFVLISSDQDFRHHLQLLTNAGYGVVVLHNAPPGSWRQALELYATNGSHQWSSIISDDSVTVDNSATASGTTDRETQEIQHRNKAPGMEIIAERPSCNIRTGEEIFIEADKGTAVVAQPPLPAAEGKGTAFPRKFVNKLNLATSSARAAPSSTSAGEVTTEPVSLDPAVTVSVAGWRLGVCLRWSGAYGFVLIHTGDQPVTADYRCSSTVLAESAIGRRWDDKSGPRKIHVDQSTGAALQVQLHPAASTPTATATVRVYVHYKTLAYNPSRLFLEKGEWVLVQVEHSEKGPRAVVVRPLLTATATATPATTAATATTAAVATTTATTATITAAATTAADDFPDEESPATAGDVSLQSGPTSDSASMKTLPRTNGIPQQATATTATAAAAISAFSALDAAATANIASRPYAVVVASASTETAVQTGDGVVHSNNKFSFIDQKNATVILDLQTDSDTPSDAAGGHGKEGGGDGEGGRDSTATSSGTESVGPLYDHDVPALAGAAPGAAAGAAAEAVTGGENMRPRICAFFNSNNGCGRGLQCAFAHETPAADSADWVALRKTMRKLVKSKAWVQEGRIARLELNLGVS